MKELWNIRMRASKSAGREQHAANRKKETHISGAEGLYEASDMQRVVKKYIERALRHPKGKVDKIIITIENIRQNPKEISALPVATVRCQTPAEGKEIAAILLQSSGISKRAMDAAFGLMKKGAMRGAAIITAEKGTRLEPDSERGIRASRLGLSRPASRSLSSRLSLLGINTDIVKEALTVASKVASCRGVVAEFCVSDDPDYTTGYVASKKFGYIRIPNIKAGRSKEGGRAFFVKEGSDIEEIIQYLERVPVTIRKIASCKGLTAIDEILNSPHQ